MFKIRASGAGQIMTDPQTNKAKEAGELSQTCKKYLKFQWIQDTYNRDKELSTPAIMKGLLNEEQGLTMLANHIGEMIYKNETHKEDEYKKGTCDVATDLITDIKCSFDIFTFGSAEITKDYDLQLQTYMDLWGLKEAQLVYVLTDTPDSLIHGEVRSILWKLQELSNPGDSRYEEIYEGLHKQRTYSDIPQKDRIKIFPVAFDESKIEALHKRVIQCRDYYSKIKL